MSLRIRLSSELPFSEMELALLIHSAPFAYKSYEIRKANGGLREVSQPTPAVKLLQRYIVANELNRAPVHFAATAYRPNIGLAENVRPHLKNRFLLKMDFKSFFPSLCPVDLETFLKKNSSHFPIYSEQDFRDLIRILFKASPSDQNLRLAIGAPSSPHLSNILLYDLDVSVQEICNKMGVVYTRYADDIAFSTSEPDVLFELEALVAGIVEKQVSPKLILNKDKTVHTSVKRGRRITGLVINNDGAISIGRDRKRQLRAEIHTYQEKKMSAENVLSLRGYISFLNSVQPAEIESLRVKYGKELIDGLLYAQENIEVKK